MFKINHKKAPGTAKKSAGQAATELAIFGAILIFLLGTIVRTAMSNGYTQNQNFKAMRMAMLASWTGSKAANTSRNSATILFVEDRLSPDSNKYGDMDRNPFIANGSGTFTYELLYPLDLTEVSSNLPVMDVFINGQYFPFTVASYVSQKTLSPTQCGPGSAISPAAAQSACLQGCGANNQQCVQNCQLAAQAQCNFNQCLRNQREWVGGIVKENQFQTIIPVSLDAAGSQAAAANADIIFNQLENIGMVDHNTVTGTGLTTQGKVTSLATPSVILPSTFGSPQLQLSQSQINQVQSILQSDAMQFKLFYTMEANGTAEFSPTPPVCADPTSTSCVNAALSSTMTLLDANNNNYTNTTGDMQYDLLRLGHYTTAPTSCSSPPCQSVEQQFPPLATSSCPVSGASSLRCYIAWQWAATAGISPAMIGLNSSQDQYPNYDIDGRLKEVTIYNLTQQPNGWPTVSYEDSQGGDIDLTWDANTCGPKPGLQNDSQIFTFTSAGTYLQIKEGKLYNPETNLFVRSVNQKDTVDLIQREIQLSNNTGRFCSSAGPLGTVANDGVTPNPVEVCIAPGSGDSCFSSENNIKSTCFDGNDNMLFVRSRLQDRRGHFWITDTSGQLKVQ